MLKTFSGTSHEVLSCLTVIKVLNDQEKIFKDYGKASVILI